MESKNTISVLLIDDEVDESIIIGALLSNVATQSYEMCWRTDRHSAMEALSAGSFDICLLDYRLGNESGLDLLKVIIETTRNLPVIFLTGVGGHRIDLEAMRAGAADYLSKDKLDSEILERSIRYSIQTARANEALRKSHDELEARVRERTEELSTANEALRLNVERLRLAHKAAGAGAWEWDLITNEIVWSEELWPLYGLEPQGCKPSCEAWRDTIHPDDREQSGRLMLEAALSGVPMTVEWRVVWADGKEHWLRSTGMPLHDSHGRPVKYVGFVQDVTCRKLAEDILRVSEQRFRAFVQASAQAIYRMSPDWSVMYELYSRDSINDTEAADRTWLERYIHPDDRSKVMLAISEAVENKSIFDMEHRVLRPDGSPGWTRSCAIPLRDGTGAIVEWFGAASDITGRKQMQDELQKSRDQLEMRVKERTADLESANKKLRLVSSQLIEAQEKERQRLACDLHDSIGQTLAALKFRMEHVINTLEQRKYTQAQQLISEFIPVLRHSIDETRTICMGLKPMLLYDYGVLAALQWYREQLMKIYPRTHIEVETEISEEDISIDLKTTIFRIAQEALNNACRHSQAEWVDLRLIGNGGTIEFEISDEGIGMDLTSILKSSAGKSLGLIGMQERAELTGGQFSLRSAPGEGTTVRVFWPSESGAGAVSQSLALAPQASAPPDLTPSGSGTDKRVQQARGKGVYAKF